MLSHLLHRFGNWGTRAFLKSWTKVGAGMRKGLAFPKPQSASFLPSKQTVSKGIESVFTFNFLSQLKSTSGNRVWVSRGLCPRESRESRLESCHCSGELQGLFFCIASPVSNGETHLSQLCIVILPSRLSGLWNHFIVCSGIWHRPTMPGYFTSLQNKRFLQPWGIISWQCHSLGLPPVDCFIFSLLTGCWKVSVCVITWQYSTANTSSPFCMLSLTALCLNNGSQ